MWRGRWPGRVLRFLLTRIVPGFLAIVIVVNLARISVGPLHEGLGLGRWRPARCCPVALAGAAHLACLGQRPLRGAEKDHRAVPGRRPPRELGQGALVGLCLITGAVAALAAIAVSSRRSGAPRTLAP